MSLPSAKSRAFPRRHASRLRSARGRRFVCDASLGLLLAAAWLLGAPRATLGQSTGDKAAAQVLFEQAREFAKQGKWTEACPKFAESQKLDPAGGTLLNLANCYEKIGRTASAWVVFMEAEADGRRMGNQRRADEAKRRAAALKPTLSTLQIDVAERVAGLVVKRGEEPVSEAQWGSAVPVDPGSYEITALAPGKKKWSGTVSVGADAKAALLTIPALETEVAAPTAGPGAQKPPGSTGGPATTPADEASDGTAQWVLGWVLGGVGLVGAGVGVVLRVMALDKDDQSLEHCLPDDPTQCDAEGVELRDQAISLQTGSLIAWAAGGAALVTGIVLLITAPSGDGAEASEQARFELLPTGGPDGGGLVVRARF